MSSPCAASPVPPALDDNHAPVPKARSREHVSRSMQGRIFSGIQPTSGIRLGNYLGAIRHWVRLQAAYDCIYCLVDQHALTALHDPAQMRANTWEAAAALIAAGVDPHRSILFAQSSVPAHAQLAWVLSCVSPLGWLNRMTQFKEKAGK